MDRDYEALKILKRLKDDFIGDVDIINELGYFYLGRKDPINDTKEFEYIFGIDHISGIKGLGEVCFIQGRYKEAEKKFRQVFN